MKVQRMLGRTHGFARTRTRDVLFCGVLAFGGCAAPGPGGAAPASDAAPVASAPVQLAPGLEVDRSRRELRVNAQVAMDRGWLEQAVCRAGTREHESLLVVEASPRAIHAGLLLLGLQPGAPGSWTQSADGALRSAPPTGDPVELWVRTAGGDRPLHEWIHDPRSGRAFPAHPWIFAGSRTRPNTPSMGPGEHYVADRTGSVVGIVTFGDEVIAFREVHADKAEVEAPEWQARTERIPAPGTSVTLLVRPAGGGAP